MGSYIINILDIPDANLIYNEDETRQILKFFWPHYADSIDDLAINNDVRRFAQQMLIAAIDASYAYGCIEGLFMAVTHRNRNIGQLAQRLARNFIHHWWQHTRQRDLDDVQIYEYVRIQIMSRQRTTMDGFLGGIAFRRGFVTMAFV